MSVERKAPLAESVAHPYRSSPGTSEADAELARLAAEGQRRERDESAERRKQSEWARLERLCDAMKLLPDVQSGGATIPTEAEFPPPAELVRGQEDCRVAPPVPALVEAAARKAYAERAWLASLPFAVDRYFTVLAGPPQSIFRLEITATLAASRAPSLEVVQGVVHSHDVDAQVTLHEGGSITVLSGPSIALPGCFPRTMRNIAPYVHGLVDAALLPIHRSHPIERVSVRTWA